MGIPYKMATNLTMETECTMATDITRLAPTPQTLAHLS